MKQKLVLLFTFVLPLFSVNAQTARTLTPVEIYNTIVGSTVVIETDKRQGSGFYVAPNIIATNFHVIEGASSATAQITDTDIKIQVVGYLAVDKDSDLILLQVTGAPQSPLRFARENTSIGEAIYAIGAPQGLSGSISDGIVSALRNFDGLQLVQISASISPGSSGCPVVNQRGEVIGVATFSHKEGQNLNFAVHRRHLQDLMKQMSGTPKRISTLGPETLPSMNTPSISVVNNTGYSAFFIYISPSSSTSWGSDHLGEGILMNGNSASFRLPLPLSTTNRYDIRLIDSDGDTYTKMNVLVTASSRIVFTFDDFDSQSTPSTTTLNGPPITIVNNTGYTIFNVYVSCATSTTWGADRLGSSEVLSNNRSATLNLPFLLNVCNRYDIRLTDSDGDTYTKTNVLVTANSRIVFTLSDID